MDTKTKKFEVFEGVEVAPSAVLKRLRRSKGYGSIQDLPNDELADLAELERQIFRNEFEAILCLPTPRSGRYNPARDTSADVDFNAFACVDFQRTQPEFDKAKYKADKLGEQLKDLVIMINIVSDRIPGKAKYAILKQVRMGIIEADDIEDWNMWQLAKLHVRIIDLRKQVSELREASKQREERRLQKLLAYLD